MRWLITGGCGFIGRNVIARILREPGTRIVVQDNLSANALSDLEAVSEVGGLRLLEEAQEQWRAPVGTVEVRVGDVRDAALVARTAAGADIVLHLAANTGVQPSIDNPRLDCETNVIGTLNVLEGARQAGGSRVLFASSGAPAGDCTPPIHEGVLHRPLSPYGASKMAGEGYCSAYANAFGLEPVVLRFSNVYGPYSGRKGSVVAKFIRMAMAGEILEIYGDGAQTRDFIFVEDLVEAIVRAAVQPGIGGETFQIGTGQETSVNELVTLLNEGLRRSGMPEIRTAFGDRRVGDMVRNYTDPSKAARVLGWRTRHSLPEGLERTIGWFLTEWRRDGAQNTSSAPDRTGGGSSADAPI